MPFPHRRELLLYLLLWPVLVLRHLSLYFTSTEFAHFDHVVWNLNRLENGTVWVKSPLLWETGLQLNGPLYYWLHLPTLLFDHPVVGIHLYYGFLELAAITLFLILGLRSPGAIPRNLVWAGALLLALFGDAKLVICENMTIASYMAIPLFMATLKALRSERARAMVLPGFLFGLMVHIHLTTLYVLPVLIAAMALERRGLARRLLWLLAGWIPVLLISLPGMVGGASDSNELDAAMATLAGRFSVERILQRLLFVLHDPLSLLGIILALAAWLRGRVGTAERLALLWILCGYLVLGTALSYMSLNWEESRFASVNPAQAVLGAQALLWLGRIARSLADRVRPGLARVHVTTALSILALGAMVLFGALTVARRADFQRTYDQGLNESCNCDLWEYETDERYVKKLVDTVKARGIPPMETDRIVVSGPMKERLGTLIHWINRKQRLAARRRGLGGTSANMHASPLMKDFDLTSLEGARGFGSFALIPRGLPVTYGATGNQGEFEVDLDQIPEDRLMFMITVHGDSDSNGPRTLSLTMGAEPVPRLDACSCEADDQYKRYADWKLFRLKRRPEAGEKIMLRLGAALEGREALWVVALPMPGTGTGG